MAPGKVSPWEEVGRARKVLAILSRIPTGETAEEVAITADWLAGLSLDDRDVLAAAAGVLPPSEKTWDRVVIAARARVPAAEAFRRHNVRASR